ncbi:hypothetical protein GCM10008171_17310 [Methylopila jiangsuensis]|uniref:Nudix hydrolase domain-containing protein n=1 Tax=Methylopila jiangsuensis TaxID=586230 RepID=A0A9W6JG74_9HYPH|nr:NUDIX hydrolase [Methylopila jiangsuensis]MDR6286991.1 8-oxo-dGTP pyrophosphatase MutT (NUDIX family) [Methylopila jiangsuensis]GLK76477.1 hypothetical protein GCM10008171_17310 [Methylopila jiangsuensis]
MGKKNSREKPHEQFAAAPYRIGADGRLEVMLITSRETRRWVVPKGWPISKLGPMGTALREAFEEAGVRGVGGASIGTFDYLKRMRRKRDRQCAVEVFPLRVLEQLDEWPEMDERERRWFLPQEASEAVQEKRLRKILLGLPERIALND